VTAVSPPPLALGELPDAVRVRVVALAADALPEVVRLPPALRRVAGFAPQRRARLGAGAIGEALDTDAELRDRVGTQVAARSSYDVAALAGAEAAAGGEAAELAALAWLVRPEGWEQVVAGVTAQLREREQAASRDTGELARLREKLAEAEQALRDARQRNRGQLDELKTENASLRRKLGESRAAERAAREAAGEHERELEEARSRAATQSAVQDKELRRLRERVTKLEAEVAAGRRAARSERDEVTVRARLLLDTVIDAASGLRRELALPSVDGAPADRLEADLVRTAEDRAGSAVAASSASPSRLERALALPRARLVVDGYNVSKTAWPSAPLEAQRTRLLGGLAPLVARLGVETTVVFDAAAAAARTAASAPRGVKVVFSPAGVIADDVIRDLVAVEPAGRVVVVVSSDQQVASDVSRAGARSFAAEALVGLLS